MTIEYHSLFLVKRNFKNHANFLIKSVPENAATLTNVRSVFDYLRTAKNPVVNV